MGLSILLQMFFFFCCRLIATPLYNRYENFLGITILVLVYGASTTPLIYLLSFTFDDASNALVATVLLNFFTGTLTVFTSFLLQVFSFLLKFL